MRKRLPILAAVLGLALAASGTAYAYDCIRVSSSPKGLAQSTKSGNWLAFNLGSTAGVQETFGNVFEIDLSPEKAECFADAYAETRQPKYFALGIGVAGGKQESPRREGAGTLAWNNKNYRVLSDGRGIDHVEKSPILSAVFGSLGSCGIPIGEEPH